MLCKRSDRTDTPTTSRQTPQKITLFIVDINPKYVYIMYIRPSILFPMKDDATYLCKKVIKMEYIYTNQSLNANYTTGVNTQFELLGLDLVTMFPPSFAF